MKRWFIRAATFIFLLQLIHLFWLTTNVVFLRLFNVSLFPSQLDWLLALVDYTEIPAIISVSAIYVGDLLKGENTRRAWRNLILLNSQWVHLFWITDEVVIAQFTGLAPVAIPVWLAWIAISIDYLELPVMWDTAVRSLAPNAKVKN